MSVEFEDNDRYNDIMSATSRSQLILPFCAPFTNISKANQWPSRSFYSIEAIINGRETRPINSRVLSGLGTTIEIRVKY